MIDNSIAKPDQEVQFTENEEYSHDNFEFWPTKPKILCLNTREYLRRGYFRNLSLEISLY